MGSDTNFNGIRRSERKPGKRVSDCLYFLEYTIEYYFEFFSIFETVTFGILPAPKSTSHIILSPKFSSNASITLIGIIVRDETPSVSAFPILLLNFNIITSTILLLIFNTLCVLIFKTIVYIIFERIVNFKYILSYIQYYILEYTLKYRWDNYAR